MGKKGGSAPKPTPPRETAAAQTGTNVSTAIANALLGNVNQYTPDGSLEYDIVGTYSYTDPYTGKTYDIPKFDVTQNLSEMQQDIKDQNDQAQLNLGQLANDQSGFLVDYLQQPVDLSRESLDSYIDDNYLDDFNRQWDRQQSDFEAGLSAQGIKVGSDAYTRAMNEFSGNRDQAYNSLTSSAYGDARSAMLAERNQPLNEITALLGGSQIDSPNFVNANMPNIPTTDVAGIIGNYDNQRMQQWQAQQQQRNSILGGLFGLGAAGIMASDMRVKTDIEHIGTVNGHNFYAFRYVWDDEAEPKRTGFMAQELAVERPEAVVMSATGLMMVDYCKAYGGLH